jgi:hypothetical protein
MSPKAQVDQTAITPPSPFRMMMREMSQIAALPPTEDGNRSQEDDIERVLNAETASDMWEADDLGRVNAKSLSGSVFEIHSIEVQYGDAADESEISSVIISPDNGRNMFLLVHSTMINKSGARREYRAGLPKTGETFVWNTSARFIVAKLWWMLKHGWFDGNDVRILARIEGSPIRNKPGQFVEKLLEAQNAVISASADTPLTEDGSSESEEPPF